MSHDRIIADLLREDLADFENEWWALLAADEQLPAPPKTPCPKSLGLTEKKLHEPSRGVPDNRETWRPRR